MKQSIWIFIVVLSFIFSLILSKNTFAENADVYISRVYATDNKEFVEIFNKGVDYEFNEISLKNNQKQIEIANTQNGVLKSNEYVTISQQSENSDLKFKEEFRNVDTISQQPILGLYINGELKDYICSDEKRCIKGYKKNSTDLKPSISGVEKIAVAKEEILKNGGKMTTIENRNGYNFGLRNLDNYTPKFGGLKLKNEQPISEIDNKNIEEIKKDSEEKGQNNISDNKSSENKESLVGDSEKAPFINGEKTKDTKKEVKNEALEKKQNNRLILAPNTGFIKNNNNSFDLSLIFLTFLNYIIIKRFYDENI